MNKRFISLALFAVVAFTSAEISHSPMARASDASAKSVIQAKLLEPLQKKEADRSRFSRAVLPPRTRRIRILESDPQADAKGRSFVPFAIDENRGYGGSQEVAENSWLKDTITGCVYPETGEVWVKRGEVYYASSMLLGHQTPTAPAGVCRLR
ncbi:MAG: hypothetical protein U1F57_10505 [bacterium]